jgi:hypothetical protein
MAMAITDGLAMATGALIVRVSAMAVLIRDGAIRDRVRHGDRHGVTARTMTATVITADSGQVRIPASEPNWFHKIQRYASGKSQTLAYLCVANGKAGLSVGSNPIPNYF